MNARRLMAVDHATFGSAKPGPIAWTDPIGTDRLSKDTLMKAPIVLRIDVGTGERGTDIDKHAR